MAWSSADRLDWAEAGAAAMIANAAALKPKARREIVMSCLLPFGMRVRMVIKPQADGDPMTPA
ncbi:hypothetical protein D3C81_1656830 [compost metagenome]